MRIKNLEISDFKPIKSLAIRDLDDVVIIAGANGSGKTRLMQAIVQTFQGMPLMDMTIEATRKEEEDLKYFGSVSIEIKKGTKNKILTNYINSRKYGAGRYVGSLVQIDSNRSVQTLKYSPVNWLGGDPDDLDSPSNFYFQNFSNRWQDFVNYIHQKSASRDKKLADKLKKAPSTGELIIKSTPDPFEKYKTIFAKLLPGKQLLDISPAKPCEFQYKDESNKTLPFRSLSSGEQEVVKVLFDVARKEIRHSVIIVDEPELHLHPTLAFKLIEALKSIGEHTNQFLFLTHSADLISTYYSTGNVYFIDSSQSGANQAHRLSDLNSSHHQVVQLIGQNLGLFAVGKKLVFVEGENSSIDRLTYHTVAQSVDTGMKIIPVGSVLNLITLSSIEEQIRNTIFGIDIYMVRDRDGLSDTQINEIEKYGRFKCLKRRHLENYFFDEDILYKVAEQLYITRTNTALTSELIQRGIKQIAENSINLNLFKSAKEYLSLNYHFKLPKVKAVETKTIDDVKREIVSDVQKNLKELTAKLETSKVSTWLDTEENKLNRMLTTDDWKSHFHGKYIFSKVCSDILKGDSIRIKQAYVDIALAEKPEILKDLTDIFNEMK
ncbi:AAA family ATPase [Candidatus Pacearchaeota archaeon]|nr:AAA family ATPase [Candidatus Pacearchaeota archaeon]